MLFSLAFSVKEIAVSERLEKVAECFFEAESMI